MEEEIKDTWGGYSKLVLKELERLNENYDKMRTDIDTKFGELSVKISEVKNIEKTVVAQTAWMDKVTDVWSPNQMKEAKDEIYKQKSRWVAAIAIVTFVQVMVGIIITLWSKLH